MTCCYRLYGDLLLPDPTAYLTHDELARLRSLKPFLHDLEIRRSQRDCVRNTPGYLDQFASFVKEETALWNLARPVNELVPPSGLLQSPIAHHLHNPSFHTLTPHDGETADESNLCIWLVMQNGFQKGQTLIFDHLSRREIVDGIKIYPKEVLKCHEDFTNTIRSNMLAEVEVVWGKCVRMRMQEQYRQAENELEPLKLWGEYQDVTVFLEWEDGSTRDKDTNRRLVRFIIFVMHPQVFLTPSAQKYARWQDLYLTVAGHLSKVKMTEDFYQKNPGASRKAFLSPKVYSKAKELGERALKALGVATGNKKLSTALAYYLKPRRSEVVPRSNSPQTGCTSFSSSSGVCKGKLSTSQLKELLADELDALSTDDLLLWDETNNFNELPRGVKQWLYDHRDLWFDGKEANSFEELVPIYQQFRLMRSFTLPLEDTAPSSMILALMETHAKCLGRRRKKPLNIENETYIPIIGPFSKMDVECSSCHAPLPPDRNARWLKSDPPRYVVQGIRHVCKQTKHVSRKRYAIPRDKAVAWTLDGANSRKALEPAAVKSKRWQELFVRIEDNLDGLPKVVDTQCESCSSKIKDSSLSDQEGKFLDKVPIWTVQDPPRYILHRRTCPPCKGDWKFVPVNPHIPYIPMKTLRDLEQSFRHVADSVAIDTLSSRYRALEWVDKISISDNEKDGPAVGSTPGMLEADRAG